MLHDERRRLPDLLARADARAHGAGAVRGRRRGDRSRRSPTRAMLLERDARVPVRGALLLPAGKALATRGAAGSRPRGRCSPSSLAPASATSSQCSSPALVLALAAFWFVGAGGRRLRRTGRAGTGSARRARHRALGRRSTWSRITLAIWQIYDRDHQAPDRSRTSLWAAARSRSALGVFPAIAGLARLWPRRRARGRPSTGRSRPSRRSMFAAFGLYGGLKAAYLSTVFANVVVERNLIYLAPLLFVGAALVLRQRPIGGGALVVGAGVRAVRRARDAVPARPLPVLGRAGARHARGGEPRARARRRRRSSRAARRSRSASAARRRPRLASAEPGRARRARTLPRRSSLGWNVVGEVSLRRRHQRSSRTAAPRARPADLGRPRGRAARTVLYLGQGIADPNPATPSSGTDGATRLEPRRDGARPGPTVTPDVVRAPTARRSTDPGRADIRRHAGSRRSSTSSARKSATEAVEPGSGGCSGSRPRCASASGGRGSTPTAGAAEHGPEPVLDSAARRAQLVKITSRGPARRPASRASRSRCPIGPLELAGAAGRTPAGDRVGPVTPALARAERPVKHVFVLARRRPPVPGRDLRDRTFPHERDPSHRRPARSSACRAFAFRPVTLIAGREASRGACARSGGSRASARACAA